MFHNSSPNGNISSNFPVCFETLVINVPKFVLCAENLPKSSVCLISSVSFDSRFWSSHWMTPFTERPLVLSCCPSTPSLSKFSAPLPSMILWLPSQIKWGSGLGFSIFCDTIQIKQKIFHWFMLNLTWHDMTWEVTLKPSLAWRRPTSCLNCCGVLVPVLSQMGNLTGIFMIPFTLRGYSCTPDQVCDCAFFSKIITHWWQVKYVSYR